MNFLKSDEVRVQDKSGLFFFISGSGHCSCGRPRCEHIKTYEEIFVRKNHRLLWLALSAMHKEIRSGDAQVAKNWAQIYLSLTSEQALRNYCRRIVFEETRSLDVFRRTLLPDVSPLSIVESLAKKAKKWELKCLGDHFSNWLAGYKKFTQGEEAENWKILDHLGSDLDVVTCYRLLFFIRQSKSLKRQFWRKFSHLASRLGNEPLISFIQACDGSSYQAMVGLEMLLGILDIEECETERSHDCAGFFIPAQKTFYYDVHTIRGKRVFLRYRDRITEGNFPPSTELDLRFSGQIWGVAWRFSARSNFKSLKDLRWEDVILLWSASEISSFDSYWYPKVYN